jgi:peptidyl-prolyl cis-trans isomerase D
MGYVVFRVEKITRPTAAGADDPRLQAIKQQYARLQAEQDFAAYLSTLRKRHGVTVNAAMLESAKDK